MKNRLNLSMRLFEGKANTSSSFLSLYCGFVHILRLLVKLWFMFFAEQAKQAKPTWKHQGALYCSFTEMS